MFEAEGVAGTKTWKQETVEKCLAIESSSVGLEFRVQTEQEKSRNFRAGRRQSLRGLEITFNCPFPTKREKKI